MRRRRIERRRRRTISRTTADLADNRAVHRSRVTPFLILFISIIISAAFDKKVVKMSLTKKRRV
jgi:uncharacterized membrane protein